MAGYKAPGVYVQDITSGSQNIEQASSSVGILIGYTKNGLINVAQKITSWTEFIAKYANGLDTPFSEDNYLPYAVYGFFNNGGNELYIGSVKHSDAVKATKTSTTNKITVTALNEGAWGNAIKISIKKASDYNESTNKEFDVIVSVGTSDSTVISGVTLETIASELVNNLRTKNWIGSASVDSSVNALEEEDFTLSGGSDGTELTDEDFVGALKMIDPLHDVTMVAIPGQTSTTVNSAVISYCTNNGLFPIIDAPMAYTVEDVKLYRKSIDAWTGALAYPWGKVSDPLTGNLKSVPTAGHIMGVYARTFENSGIHKAPAGVDATVNGFVELDYQITPTDLGNLNQNGVICICARPNAGIVIWGARSLNSSDSTMRYVTDGIMNLVIKKSIYDGTQFAVFESNDESLWKRLESSCKAFLEELRLSGALKGNAEEAYYVTVDASNNTDETIANGQLNIEVGYAPVKPAEFIIIKLAHSISGTII